MIDKHETPSSAVYDASYFASHCGPFAYERSNPHWTSFFNNVADELIRLFRPRRVFDAGCAHGFLVEAFWDRGVEAWGRDISEFAISQVRPDVRPYCSVGSIVEPIEGRFDLVVCIEVLEHISEAEGLKAIANMTSAAEVVVLSSSPSDFEEPTHINVRPGIYWMRAFAERFFVPEVGASVAAITPHAVAFARADTKPDERYLLACAEIVRSRVKAAQDQSTISILTLERNKAQADRELAVAANMEASERLNQTEALLVRATKELDRALAEKDAALAGRARAEAECEHARLESSATIAARDGAASERDAMAAARDYAASQRDAALAELSRLALEQAQALFKLDEAAALRAALAQLAGEHARLREVADYARAAEPIGAENGSNRPWGAWRALARRARAQAVGFDKDYYVRANPDVVPTGNGPIDHFLRFGQFEGRFPNKHTAARAVGFDYSYYALNNEDVVEAGFDPLQHYLIHGRYEGRLPNARATARAAALSAGFDSDFYRRRNPDVASSGVDLLDHYIDYGKADGRFPNAFEREAAARSLSFDAAFYSVRYPDVIERGYDQLDHYIRLGRSEGRFPNAEAAGRAEGFDADFYRGEYPDVAASGVEPLDHYVEHGWKEGRHPNAKAARRARGLDLYEQWVQQCDTLTDDDRTAIRCHIEALSIRPLISVVVPAYNTNERLLREMIDSVLGQLYQNWELCIADDASTQPHVLEVLREFAERDPRIRFMRREVNGHICAATNSALELASGEFVALLDHDDLLPDKALYEVALEINAHPDADLIYSDSDSINDNGVRSDAYFKTDWNPDLMLVHNMISHLGVYRRSIVTKIGGLRLGFEGSQDYDLALRVIAETTASRIRHIPAILYHWRREAAAPSFSESSLDRCYVAARRTIRDHLDQKGIRATLEIPPRTPHWTRVKYETPKDRPPLVSVIIPTRDRADLLSQCVDGVLSRTDYPRLELIIVDNESVEPETHRLFERLRSDSRVTIVAEPGAFNFARLNNVAVAQARGEVLLLLNNDVDVIGPLWLEEMVMHALRPEVGAVGALLMYPDRRVQHAGVVLGVGHGAGHLFHGVPRDTMHYWGFLEVVRQVSAVTAACLALRRSIYLEVGGFDEQAFPVAFNDVDLCLRIRAREYAVVWTPFAELYHHESASRGLDDVDPERLSRLDHDADTLAHRWGDLLKVDPFYNVNCAFARFDPGFPSRRAKPWVNFIFKSGTEVSS